MHTLILSFPYESAPGGGERYLEQTVEGLLAQDRSFTLVSSSRALLDVFRRRSWDHLPLWLGIEPVTPFTAAIFPLTVPFFLPLVIGVLALARVFSGTRTVLCLSLGDKLLATVPARLLGMRVVWMEHLIPGRSLAQNPYLWLYRRLSELARVATVSEAVRGSLAALGIRRERIEVIPPGIVVREDERADLSKPIVGIVSRLSKEKNVGAYVEAFAGVLKQVPEAELRIFGTGAEERDLRALAERLGIGPRVRFEGYVADRRALYGGLRFLAVPSLRESFGIAALEAMAWGVPVLASDVGGLPEVVADGETGALLQPGDTPAWTEKSVEWLMDREAAARLGDAGRARAVTRFSLEKTVSAWKGLLDGTPGTPQ